MTHGVWLGSRMLYDHYVGLTGEFDYRLTIDGYDIALTEAQFNAMYQSRLALWDEGAKAAEERIIKLLEDEVGWNKNDRCDCQMCANRRTIEQTKVERLKTQIRQGHK